MTGLGWQAGRQGGNGDVQHGHRCNAIKASIARQNAQAVIPSTTNQRAPIPYDRFVYRARNQIERLWCWLKDWRRVATQYDKLAANYLAGASIAATILYWSN